MPEIIRRPETALREFHPDGMPVMRPGEVHIHEHVHIHQAAPAAAPAAADDRGWLLLHRMVPYLVIAAICAVIICGSIGILALTLSFVMAALLAIVASAEALVASAVTLVVAIALFAWVVGSLTGVSTTTVSGKNNRVGVK